jgi:signal transduction histidine kinase/pSer/pThr/pTyr-binding forkhead associated (FHA) protein
VPRLLVIKGADEGKQFDLSGQLITVGRDGTNRIRLHDTEVSRRHAEFRQVEGGYIVVDIGSANGTFINNQRIQEALLQAGDQIVIGQSILVYSSGTGETQEEKTDLAEKISMISRHDLELSSAIVKTIGESEGSRILTHPDKSSPWLKTALANLAIMYEASQAVSHILDLNELLNRILELIFRSVEADRGCIMLKHSETGQLEPKAVRQRGQDQAAGKFTVSRTIMEHVLKQKEGVLVSDAAQDERFSAGQSILRFGIREVICVPMKGRHETLGVLYLDTHTGPRELVTKESAAGKFTEEHLALAIAVAHQAALAVEETRYHQAMLQAERLAAIGQTIAALSHHIKNILQGLRSGSEILKMGLKDRDETMIQQGWRIAEKNHAKIYELVLDMLTFSKEREPAVELTDVNQIVRDVVELMAGRAKEKGVKLEVSLEQNQPDVPADPEGIHRALLNIVSNAMDAIEERSDGKITVGTRWGHDEGVVKLIVMDNGTGIPPEVLSDIFKPFASTKGSKGTGLGLAVSRKILREHGGDIVVQSQVGVGSKFTLRLPLKSPLLGDSAATNDEIPIMPPPE